MEVADPDTGGKKATKKPAPEVNILAKGAKVSMKNLNLKNFAAVL